MKANTFAKSTILILLLIWQLNVRRKRNNWNSRQNYILIKIWLIKLLNRNLSFWKNFRLRWKYLEQNKPCWSALLTMMIVCPLGTKMESQ
jgi:hypothetical protein